MSGPTGLVASTTGRHIDDAKVLRCQTSLLRNLAQHHDTIRIYNAIFFFWLNINRLHSVELNLFEVALGLVANCIYCQHKVVKEFIIHAALNQRQKQRYLMPSSIFFNSSNLLSIQSQDKTQQTELHSRADAKSRTRMLQFTGTESNWILLCKTCVKPYYMCSY